MKKKTSIACLLFACLFAVSQAQTSTDQPADPSDPDNLATDYFSQIMGVAASASTNRSEEHTSELKSLMRISYAVFCLKKKTELTTYHHKPLHTYTQYK